MGSRMEEAVIFFSYGFLGCDMACGLWAEEEIGINQPPHLISQFLPYPVLEMGVWFVYKFPFLYAMSITQKFLSSLLLRRSF